MAKRISTTCSPICNRPAAEWFATSDDPTNRRRMVLEFDDSFRECVDIQSAAPRSDLPRAVHLPPDAYALAERGIDAGLRVLQPGESFQAHVAIRWEPLA